MDARTRAAVAVWAVSMAAQIGVRLPDELLRRVADSCADPDEEETVRMAMLVEEAH